MAGPEIYRLRGVGYSYGAVVALEDVSFSVAEGESLAILGANGSGKSTLLKVMNGLIPAARGTVEFFGRGLSPDALTGEFLSSFRERVGLVFSEPDVQLFSPTVFEEVGFAPRQLGLSEREVMTRTEELLSMLGIAALGERAPYTLSSGEKKKVAIASVLSTGPDVLLLDEPTNGLDPRTQVWLFELLEAMRGMGKTIVTATHDLSLVADLADRAVVVGEDHRVAAVGPASSVLTDTETLLEANIIHEHAHRHGEVTHIHGHGPYSVHDEHDRGRGLKRS